VLRHKIEVLYRHCAEAGRDPGEVSITVLDLPVVGADRDEVWSRVEALRGRSSAAAYARTHHAGTHAEQRERYVRLGDLGVRTVFLAPPHLTGPEDVLALAPMVSP
jgi:alkanesulfonate monooxygenase SsuD/methylene tetrahydromethanopterin reductase-like flavin-dependent oxidoreductase (luciferase family)